MDWYEVAIVLGTLALFLASMWQGSLIRKEQKLSAKPVLAFSVMQNGHRMNLCCTNIGNGLAKHIEFVVKVKDRCAQTKITNKL